ncbi:MAG: sugar transferase [Bacteroidales bacterium]|nr:sugar transferase [Bacteroidales bacterium]
MKDILIRETGESAFEFISEYVSIDSKDTLVVSTSTAFNIDKQHQSSFKSIININQINNIRRINKFFESVNAKLDDNGLFICNVETYILRKKRILNKYPKGINWGMYTFDFFVKRVSPKVWGLKKVYFFTTAGRNRVLSKAETLGRIYSCGFEVVKELYIKDRLWVVVKKVKEPSFDSDPTYGPLISLKRHGKDGKLIKVYKARTMHAYSEYLQEYVYQNNSLQEGGKFKNDFRITTLGRIFRKLWLDELPMILNLLKRDLKIVGVRPLSKQYMGLYPEEFQEYRKKYKPGLVPPFYADLPKDLDEIIASERNYLESYEKNPIRTDWKYFWKAFNNIVFKKARSN